MPREGETKTGDVLNTTSPEPLSSLTADASCAELKLPSDAAPDATVVIAPVSGVSRLLPVQRQLPDPSLLNVNTSPATVNILAQVGNIKDVALWVNVSAPENIKVR